MNMSYLTLLICLLKSVFVLTKERQNQGFCSCCDYKKNYVYLNSLGWAFQLELGWRQRSSYTIQTRFVTPFWKGYQNILSLRSDQLIRYPFQKGVVVYAIKLWTFNFQTFSKMLHLSSTQLRKCCLDALGEITCCRWNYLQPSWNLHFLWKIM